MSVRLVLMLAAAAVAAPEPWLSDIGLKMHSELYDAMGKVEVNYSEPVINTTYVARVDFDMRAMGMLYNSTHLVIDFIANKQAYPEGMVSVSDGHLEVAPVRENWRALLSHYAGPAGALLLAALFAAALPLAGLFWCCCQWCRVGRRRRPFDRKYDVCIKGILAILLIGLLTLFLFGVVCAFATDSQVEGGTAATPGALRRGLRDARAFLNATQAHARHLLVDNYAELERRLDAVLTYSGVLMSQRLGEVSRGAAVGRLQTLLRQLPGARAALRDVRDRTHALRAHAQRLNAGLRKVKALLLQTLNDCEQPKCRELKEKYKIGQLDTEIQYSQMPDVSEVLGEVSALLEGNLTTEVSRGLDVLRALQSGLRGAVDDHAPDVRAALADTGRQLSALADSVTALAGNASERLAQQAGAADALQRALDDWGADRRHTGRAAAAALLLITCLTTWGLVCGVCGKRPDVYGASDCCNKGAGASCLLCGMAVTFVVGGAVTLVMMVYFAAGLAGQRFVCDPLTEPRGNRVFADAERFVELQVRGAQLNLSTVLLRCHDNLTIYETLELWRIYDLDSLPEKVSHEVSQRAGRLKPTLPRDVVILGPAARTQLRRLADAGLSDFQFERILQALETNMTSLELEGLVSQLRSTAAALAPRAGYADVAASLQDAAASLAALQADVLQPMLEHTERLNETAIKLRDGLRFNYTSLREAIYFLMDETTQAEAFLNNQGPELVHNLTQEFASAVSEQLQRYAQRVQHAARHEVGRCGPVSRAFNATRDAVCRAVLLPVNGYWISLAWCVVLFVPMLLVSSRLARLYRHADPYPGPLVEAEYLYDAYADRDNVPLANTYKAEKRGGRGRAGGAGGAGGAGPGEPAPPLAPPLDAHHARRYNDMAPKHWEEGPPRYHGPTEYERPPPYYYPGPNDRQ
ncbi:prominin-like protein isoform X2 [Battus philenor]|uniref:prominin-like protein isoform X2 n=1 Tax=Battus philenor TaxID=42288 RepID=UPI0035CE9CEF